MDRPDDVTDEDLLERFARERGEEDFARLVSRHGDLLFSLALRSLGSPADAEDAAQAAWIEICRSAARYGRKGSARAWMARIVIHKARDWSRRERRTEARERRAARPEAELPRLSLEADEMRAVLEAKVRGLPADLREPLLLFYYEGLSQAEVAEALERPLGTIKRQIHEGVRALRSQLGRAGLALPLLSIVAIMKGSETHAASEAFKAALGRIPLAAGGGAAVQAGAGAGAGMGGGSAVIGGAIMKTKITLFAAALALASASFGIYRWMERPARPESPGGGGPARRGKCDARRIAQGPASPGSRDAQVPRVPRAPGAEVPAPPSGATPFEAKVARLGPEERAIFEAFRKMSIVDLIGQADEVFGRAAWREADLLRMAIASKGADAVQAMSGLARGNDDWYLQEMGLRVLAEMKGDRLIDGGPAEEAALESILAAYAGESPFPDGYDGNRRYALQALSSFRGERVVQALLGGLEDASPLIRTETIQALNAQLQSLDPGQGSALRSAGIERIKKALFFDPSREVQTASASALCWLLGPKEGAEALIDVFRRSEGKGTKLAVIEILRSPQADPGKAAGDLVAPFLNESFRGTRDPALKASLLRAMGRYGDEQTLSAVQQGLGDDDASVREAALRALPGLPVTWTEANASAVLSAVGRMSSDPDPGIRLAALASLCRTRIGEGALRESVQSAVRSRGVDFVERILAEPSEIPSARQARDLRSIADDTGFLFTSMTTSRSEDLKVTAIASLASDALSSQRERSLPVLRRAVESEASPVVRRAALLAGVTLQDRSVLPALASDLRSVSKGPASYAYIAEAGRRLRLAFGIDFAIDPRASREAYEAALKRLEGAGEERR